MERVLNESGAPISSTHYIAASVFPVVNTLLQLQRLGGPDPFATEPRLARFAEFYLSLLTPPEERFGGARKVVSIGNSSTEQSALYGVLATAFRASNPTLSARLMGAWQAQGKPHDSFLGSTLLLIDENAPAGPSEGNP